MKVTLLHNTPLWVASTAIRTCWQSQEKSDTVFYNEYTDPIDGTWEYDEVECGKHNTFEVGENDKALIDRVGNKFKHASTLEHLSYNFYIEGISRACLQELARHRIASLSVKSSRYTLKELKKEVIVDPETSFYDWDVVKKYIVLTGHELTDDHSALALARLKDSLDDKAGNDRAKYCMPEAYKTELTWTINARALQNFLKLRSSKAALWEIRDLANAIFNSLPEEHKYLFEDSMEKVNEKK